MGLATCMIIRSCLFAKIVQGECNRVYSDCRTDAYLLQRYFIFLIIPNYHALFAFFHCGGVGCLFRIVLFDGVLCFALTLTFALRYQSQVGSPRGGRRHFGCLLWCPHPIPVPLSPITDWLLSWRERDRVRAMPAINKNRAKRQKSGQKFLIPFYLSYLCSTSNGDGRRHLLTKEKTNHNRI